MAEPFVLGVNYWPRRKAMYWWANYDADEVREEFALIRDLGMSVVRIFLMWEDFQPTPDTVSPEALKNLRTTCDIAAENGLGLDVTFFTGHMSGPNWAPGWMLLPEEPMAEGVRQVVSGGQTYETGYRNYFIDPTTREAQRLLVKTVVSELKDHPGVWMWNLGNEPDLFAIAPDRETSRGWVQEMTDLIKSIDPTHPVTCGLHVASLYRDDPLRVDDTFNITDVAVMHSYPMYTSWLDDPLDTDFVPYTCALVTALCGKPTLMEEWGGPTAQPGQDSFTWEWEPFYNLGPHQQFMASEEAFADYIRGVLPKLVEVGATGSLTWCFADYTPDLYDKPPCAQSRHERYFGLVRPDGSLKPHAEVIREFAASNPTVQPATRPLKMDITPEEYYESPTEHLKRLYKVFTGK